MLKNYSLSHILLTFYLQRGFKMSNTITYPENRGSFNIHLLGKYADPTFPAHMADIIGSGYGHQQHLVNIQMGNFSDSDHSEFEPAAYCGSTLHPLDKADSPSQHWWVTKFQGRGIYLAMTFGESHVSTYAIPIPEDLDWYDRAEEMLNN